MSRIYCLILGHRWRLATHPALRFHAVIQCSRCGRR